MSSAVKPIHTIHVGGEETGLMEPVNVIVTKPSTATTGIKTTFQSFKYVILYDKYFVSLILFFVFH